MIRNVGLAALLAALAMPAMAGSAARPVDLELVLAVDVSDSMDKGEARLQRDGYRNAIADPNVLAAIRAGSHGRIAVAYMVWAGAGQQAAVVGWTLIEDAAGARAFADQLATAPVGSGRWTSISAAIDYAVPMFADNRFQGARRVIDISGDGSNNAGSSVTAARDRAVALGITINGLVVLRQRRNFSWPPIPHLDRYFRRCVIGGPGAFMVVVETASAFAGAVRRKLIREIAGRMGDETGPMRLPAAGAGPAACHDDENGSAAAAPGAFSAHAESHRPAPPPGHPALRRNAGLGSARHPIRRP